MLCSRITKKIAQYYDCGCVEIFENDNNSMLLTHEYCNPHKMPDRNAANLRLDTIVGIILD